MQIPLNGNIDVLNGIIRRNFRILTQSKKTAQAGRMRKPERLYPMDNIIIYNTDDGAAKVSLYANDGTVWMTQAQMAELFQSSKQNIG